MMMEESKATLRETIEQAFDAPAQSDAPAPTPAPTPAASPEQDSVAESSPAPDAQADKQDLNALAEKEPVARARNERGQFTSAAPAEGIQPAPKPGPKIDRGPASWRPDVREHWSQLPEDVRNEVLRREHEIQRAMQESSEARKSYESMARVIEPYQAFIKAEGATNEQAVENLMATAARFRTGTGPEVAQMVAGIVKNFGVGRFGPGFIGQLDAVLAGQQVQVDPQQAAFQQALDQRLAPMQQMLNQFQQAQQYAQERTSNQAQSEVMNFLQTAEFGEDVRQEMADLLELANRRGENITLTDAYRRACLSNDRIVEVLKRRQAATQAQASTDAARRARSAAVQVSSSAAPMGQPVEGTNDVRSAIEAAIAMTAR
jgi:hypothetical protein